MTYTARHLATNQTTEQTSWDFLVGHVADFFPWFETTAAMTEAIQKLEIEPLPLGPHYIAELGTMIVVSD